MDRLSLLLQFLSSLDWTGVIGFLGGAFVTSVISYKFTGWRESQRLRFDLQVKTTDAMISELQRLQSASAALMTVLFTHVRGYNIQLRFKGVETPDMDSKGTELGIMRDDLYQRRVTAVTDDVKKDFDNHFDRWQHYSSAFIAVISVLESREVILNRFIGFKFMLLEKYQVLIEDNTRLMDLYHHTIFSRLVQSEPIEEESLKKLDELADNLRVTCCDIASILWDLRVGLQNAFFSKLFRYKVKIRQPLDKSLPVYEPGFLYTAKAKQDLRA